ncbi:MAG: SCP2 sterol-binding domain-containing protein [Clostridiales bacterium]|nr:SCP2 sterol-binding domain-containing protein [Clostridiales bacterium]
MYFEEAFKKIKTALEKADVTADGGHFAIQVRMTDEDCGGIFYIEQADKQFFVEPYDYYDNDVDVAASYKSILSMAQGKLDIENAIADGTVYAGGNVDAFIAFAKSIKPKKAAKKTAAKKTTAKAAEKKTTRCCKKTVKETEKAVAKKAEAAKMAEDKKITKTDETIAKVVEKEVKPDKKASKTKK